MVGMDGCFMKKENEAVIISSWARSNNNTFFIAYAMVERQTKDSWIWFLQLLDNDIGFEDQHAWTFMSEKQKGLILSFEHLIPNIENRFCVRHLHSNMKHDGFRGVSV